jgi:hypothetical protein
LFLQSKNVTVEEAWTKKRLVMDELMSHCRRNILKNEEKVRRKRLKLEDES